MKHHNPKVYAALGLAGLALALSIHTAVRGPREAQATDSNACIDQEARDQAEKLRRMLAERELRAEFVARGAAAPGGDSPAAAPSQRRSTPADPGPHRYVHFEIPNPAVSVTQKEDWTYDIRTTDPALAGSILKITAVTQSGAEDELLIRIPEQ